MKNILQNFKKFIILAGSSLLSLGVVLIHIYENDIDYKDCFDFEDGQITKFNFESCGWEKGKNDKIVIPDKINGQIVERVGLKDKSIGDLEVGICGDNLITSVKIPDTVTEIGLGAFYNCGLESVKISNSIRKIGFRAFAGNNLRTLALPSGLNKIGQFAFVGNKLESLTIPNSVTSIASVAFAGNKIESLTLSNKLTSISSYVFENNRLKSIELPVGIELIGIDSFGSNKLESIKLPEGLKTIGLGAFESNKLEAVNLPDSIEEIMLGAFIDNNIIKVKMPKNIKFTSMMIGGVFDKNGNLKDKYMQEDKQEGLYIRDDFESSEWRLKEKIIKKD